LKESKGKSQDQNAGSTRDYSVRLPGPVAASVEHMARGEGKTVEQWLLELITAGAEDQAKPLGDRLEKVRALINQIAISTRKMPLQEGKDAKTGSISRDERKKKRDHLVELGIEAFDELKKIASSEEAAKEAEFRLHAFMVMARLGSYSAALIRDQEAEDLEELIAEVEKCNDEFEEKLNKIEQKEKER
jgi:hypothetical protein